MPYFFLGIALLAAALLLARWFVNAEPQKIAANLKVGGAVVLGLICLLLLVTGRFSLLMMVFALLFFIRRALKAGRLGAHTASGPSPGQASEVRTRYLQMMLDHDSGEMDGEILDGRFMGMWLSQLGLTELLQLLADYEDEDPQSASVLEAYLDRTRDDAWRKHTQDGSGEGAQEGEGRARPGGAMSRDEALEILGLREGATAAQIREAHRRLMQKIHPDHGGSNYLAAKLNEAKDLLLGT